MGDIALVKANKEDINILHHIQIKSFKELLERYQDYEISPGNESIEQIIERYEQPFTTYWIIKDKEKAVGGVRVVSGEDGKYRISPIFVLPEEQGKGIAQETFKLLEAHYYDSKQWFLNTIQEEKKNCYLYEKLGYKKIGKTEKIKSGMTIVSYQKIMNNCFHLE